MAFTEITPEEININPFYLMEQVRSCNRGKYREMQYASCHLGRLRRHVEKENRHHLHPTEPFHQNDSRQPGLFHPVIPPGET